MKKLLTLILAGMFMSSFAGTTAPGSHGPSHGKHGQAAHTKDISPR